MPSSSASTSIPLDTYSSASQAVFWSYLCTLVFQSKSGVTSPSWPRGWQTLSNSIHTCTNSGGHFICPRSHNITIRVNLSIETVSRPYKRNLQSRLWRASFKGAGRKRICQALKSRGSLLCSGSVYWLWNGSQQASRLLHGILCNPVQLDQDSAEARDKAIEELHNRVSDMWLHTNLMLFKHVLNYETKLDAFLDKAGGWIRVQEECIWMTMRLITEDVRAPLSAGLTIVFHLLDTLPSFPADLMYHSTPPMITGFVPEVYAQWPWLGLHSLDLTHTPPPDSHRKAIDVLKEEIFCSTGGNARPL